MPDPKFPEGDFIRDLHQLRTPALRVERQLEIIGEALGIAAKEDDSILELVPDIPRTVGLRNPLIHGYDSVDPELVWDVVKTKIPPLKHQIAKARAQSAG